MKIDLNEIELGYLNELIELEQANNLNTDIKNKNNIMVNELVKKLTIPDVVDECPHCKGLGFDPYDSGSGILPICPECLGR